jgi:transcriptional regulator with XRE-family HTH domain
MNFAQMHERLRLELLRRIQRGSLSVSLLARQTGFAQAHISNFLHSRRRLSLDAVDRILAAQHLTVSDLIPAVHDAGLGPETRLSSDVPLVSHSVALFEPLIRPSAIQSFVHVPPQAIQSVRARASNTRRGWQRFVAVRINASDAMPMEPLVMPDAIVIIDRHYNSLFPYRPTRPNLYAVRHVSHLTLRYVEFLADRLVLRPHNNAFPLDWADPDPGETPNDLLAGRVALILNEL